MITWGMSVPVTYRTPPVIRLYDRSCWSLILAGKQHLDSFPSPSGMPASEGLVVKHTEPWTCASCHLVDGMHDLINIVNACCQMCVTPTAWRSILKISHDTNYKSHNQLTTQIKDFLLVCQCDQLVLTLSVNITHATQKGNNKRNTVHNLEDDGMWLRHTPSRGRKQPSSKTTPDDMFVF